MKLREKVVVISGGASGLGKRTAEHFVRDAGARVVILDQNDQAGAAVRSALARFGAIDVCINCAGVAAPMKVLDKEGKPNCAKFQRTIMINLVGTFNVTAHCVAAMVKNPLDGEERGVVINVASAAAFDGQVGQTAYGSSKAGVVGLSLPAARELGAVGIRV